MSGARSRRKGQVGEREALKALGDELGTVLTRNLEQTREGGGDCLQIKGWVVEVKRCETLKIPAWWRQAVRQAEGRGEPMLLFRQSRKPWRALIHAGAGHFREGTIADAAGAIREKLLAWP